VIDSENVSGRRNPGGSRVNSLIGTLIEFRIERRPSGRRKVRSICSEAKARASREKGNRLTDPFLPGKLKNTSGPFRCGIWRRTFSSFAECRGCEKYHQHCHCFAGNLFQHASDTRPIRNSNVRVLVGTSFSGISAMWISRKYLKGPYPFSFDSFHSAEQKFQFFHRYTVARQHSQHVD